MSKIDYVKCDFCGTVGPSGHGFSRWTRRNPLAGSCDPKNTEVHACITEPCRSKLEQAINDHKKWLEANVRR